MSTLSTVAAFAQPAREQPTEVEPIRCWWRSSKGAVATGEPFTLTLTCAVLETSSVRVVPDESQLAAESIQLAPFGLVGGVHPADLRSGQRRFVQYEYQLRVIDANAIGKDVSLPQVAIHYRVESQVQAQVSEGRDLTYLLPLLSVRVLSTVPTDATDIRDGSDAPFGVIEGLRLRARVLNIAAIAFSVLGVIVLAPAIFRAIFGPRRKAKDAAVRLSDRAVLGAAATELAAVQSESRGGWTPALITRALTAVRVATAYALGKALPHRVLARGAEPPEGRLVLSDGLMRRRRAAVTSPVTAVDVARELAALPPSASRARRAGLETLQSSLVALTRAQYSSNTAEPPDDVVTSALETVQQLRRDRGWVRWFRAQR